MAVQVIVLHEWETNPWHRSRPMPANSHYTFDFLSLGGREYGVRHGIWRLLDVLERHDVKATVLANGIVAELFPDSLRAAAERGHEIAAHQWDQSIFPPMFTSRDEERTSLARTKDALETVTKRAVTGYMSPGPRSTPHTLDLLAELDFRWACEYVDSDFPYVIPVGGKEIVAISYATPGCIDFDLLTRGVSDRLEELKITFAAAYKESDRHPMKFCYAVHTHWGGTVGMAWVLDEFLSYVRRHEDVWYPRHSDVADFWLKQSRASQR
jgi:peptidoglycan/xylan/chitin deacetylase (PgdA/CDA1 family)